MTPAEIEKKWQAAVGKCICGSCPSWVECKEKGGFCFHATGKSKCIKKEKGCICMGCPATKEMELKNVFYCTRGPEKEQAGA